MITVKALREKLEDLNYDIISLTDEETILFHRLGELREHEGKLVKHFKGNFYLVLGTVTNTETDEEMVLYKSMHGKCKKYVRPIDSFLSKVDREKYSDAQQEYRLEFVHLLDATAE